MRRLPAISLVLRQHSIQIEQDVPDDSPGGQVSRSLSFRQRSQRIGGQIDRLDLVLTVIALLGFKERDR